jgi:dihydroorotase
MRLSIVKGRVVDPASGLDTVADVHLADGLIAAIGDAPAGFAPDRVIDASGLVVAPGLVDLAARLREPGFEYRATLESEMRAAVAGGITSLSCPPDTDPPLDEPGLVEMLKHRARGLDGARLYPLGALTVGLKGEMVTEMAELAEAGCVGFSQAGQMMTDTQNRCAAVRALRPPPGCGEDPHLARRHGARRRGAARLGLPGIRRSPRPWHCTSSSSWCAPPAAACTCAGSRRPRASGWCAPPRPRACR